MVAPTGAQFADVALMGVGAARRAAHAGAGLRAGSGGFAERLRPLGMPVEVLGAEPGAAAARKLLRSVFMKGLAASCLGEPARRARRRLRGVDARGDRAVLTGADAALLERLVTGSARHATRRIGEVRDARELLAELGVQPRVTDAAGGWLAQLESEERNDGDR